MTAMVILDAELPLEEVITSKVGLPKPLMEGTRGYR
jgi:hypothetical protein